jgi:hypothetical protein
MCDRSRMSPSRQRLTLRWVLRTVANMLSIAVRVLATNERDTADFDVDRAL